MADWRRSNKRISNHHQVGQRRSSSSYGKPPLAKRFASVPWWEKKFCATVGSVSWKKVIEGKRFMFLHPTVINWDDSAVKEAFDNAKNRFWADINGFPCDIPLPDPNIHIDDVDSTASVDPQLYLDVESEAEASDNMEEKRDVTLIIDNSLLVKKSFADLGIVPTGWGDEEEKDEVRKPSEPNYASQGWELNQHENDETNSWERYWASVDKRAKEYGWKNGQNNSQRRIQRERFGGNLHNKYQGRNGGSGNWGTWDGYNRRRDNMSWSKNPGYHHGTSDYQMNRGRGRGGGRRGNFAYADKVTTPSAW
ncbi:uncharacterized protein [Medicago truncatula]|uniref:Uncharacterized protein n=1 Tax=Medicago truncatula TaxID=3880 RepID=G7KSK6_MEDTR|nr:uncharacterized protein LOC11420154 [Medicago truncatula]AES81306.1 hypothetical protein MTR_7g090800 [Medicago truncatula]